MVFAAKPDTTDPQVQYEVNRIKELQSEHDELERKFDKNMGKRDMLNQIEDMRMNGADIPTLIRQYRKVLPDGINESNFHAELIKEIDRLYFSVKILNGRMNAILGYKMDMYPQGRLVLNC